MNGARDLEKKGVEYIAARFWWMVVKDWGNHPPKNHEYKLGGLAKWRYVTTWWKFVVLFPDHTPARQIMRISWILQRMRQVPGAQFLPTSHKPCQKIGRRIVSSGGYAYGRILCCGNRKIPGVFDGTRSWCCCRRSSALMAWKRWSIWWVFFEAISWHPNGGPFSFGWLFLGGFDANWYKLTWGSQVSVEWFVWFRRTLDSKTTCPVRKGHSSHSFVFPTSIKIQNPGVVRGSHYFITLPSSPHLQSFLAKCQRSALP